MANIKISELNSGTTLSGIEVLPIVQNGQTVNISVNDIKDYSRPYKQFVSKLQASVGYISNITSTSGLFDMYRAPVLLKGIRYMVVVPSATDDFSNLIEIKNNIPFDQVGCVFVVTGDTSYNDKNPLHFIPKVWSDTELVNLTFLNNSVLKNDFGYDLEWFLSYDESNGYSSISISFPEDVNREKLTLNLIKNGGNFSLNNQQYNDDVYYETNKSHLNYYSSFTNIDSSTQKNGLIGFDGEIWVIKTQNDGKILIGGGQNNIEYGTANNFIYQGSQLLTRLNEDFSIDQSFAMNLYDTNGASINGSNLSDLLLLDDGKMIIIGDFYTVNDGTQSLNLNGICKLNSDGTIDGTTGLIEGDGFDNYVYSIDKTSDGKIVVGGQFSSYIYSGETVDQLGGLIILNDDLSPYSGFTNIKNKVLFDGSTGNVTKVLVTENDEILLCGHFNTYMDINNTTGNTIGGLIKLTSGFTFDENFTNNIKMDGNYQVNTMSLQGQKIVASINGGSLLDYPNAKGICRFNSDGTFDETFYYNTGNNEGLDGDVYSIDITNDRIIVGGYLNSYSELVNGVQYDNYLYGSTAVFNSDGKLIVNEESYGVSGSVNIVKHYKDKKYFVGGNFNGSVWNSLPNTFDNFAVLNYENDASISYWWDYVNIDDGTDFIVDLKLYE